MIFRGLALGIALTVYGREEGADTLIEQMTRDQDPIIRYGGMYALALAYSGTANNKAIRQLLHFAVSDVSDDVRRTAVLALGFVLYSDPEQVSFSCSIVTINFCFFSVCLSSLMDFTDCLFSCLYCRLPVSYLYFLSRTTHMFATERHLQSVFHVQALASAKQYPCWSRLHQMWLTLFVKVH